MNSYFTVAAISYLLGSIPFGYLLLRFIRGEDVRSSGSGNIGATNVARRSPALGVVTLLLDAGKGVTAVLLAKHLFADQNQILLPILAAFLAVVGHMFPVWLKFRGGKGVATGFGSFALIAPKSILCMLGIFVIIVAISRYVSLGSVTAAAALPILAWSWHESADEQVLLLMLAASILIIWKHRQNLSRLASGTETKLGARAQ
jgi:glycerol-3-phosphate acyltransferase PlsY